MGGSTEGNNNDDSVEGSNAEDDTRKFTVGEKGLFVFGAFEERKEGETPTEECWEEERAKGEDEWRKNKKEKQETPDNVLATFSTQEDREGIDMIAPIALDVLEIFDREDQEIGKKEIDEEREWDFTDRMRGSYRNNTYDQDEYTSHRCQECRDSGILLETEGRSGVEGGECLVGKEEEHG